MSECSIACDFSPTKSCHILRNTAPPGTLSTRAFVLCYLRNNHRNSTEALLELLQILSFDETAMIRFDQLRTTKGLRKIGRADLLIASITIACQAMLVTHNVRHFQVVPDLRVVNWVDR